MYIFFLKILKKKAYEENENAFINHLNAVRSLEDFKYSTIIFIPESNYAFEGTHLARSIRMAGFKNACIMKEDDNRPGFRTDQKNKKEMALSLKVKLMEKGIYIYQHFVCTAEGVSNEKMLDELQNELLNYSRIIKPSNVKYKKPTEIYSGKQDYGFDDLVIALQLNLIMKNRFYEKKEVYSKWW